MHLFVLAHGLVGRTDLPIPKWLFGWAAAVVLVLSFAALAVLWPQPELQEERGRRWFRMPGIIEPLLVRIGVIAFVAVVYAGLRGAQDAQDNLAPTIIYVHFWVGMAVVSVLFGDVFRALNPWRAIARFVAWIANLVSREEMPAPLQYPAKLGRWPAAISILIFVWVELAYVNRDDPSQLAIMALAYAALQLIGMAFYGIETWEKRADRCVVITHQKGRDTKENVKRNFGCAHPEGYRKALRLMRLAEKFRLPVISLIDTPGAYPGIGSEERHISEAIAVNLREMMNLRV